MPSGGGKVGRPSDYSEELAETICERIGLGESLESICRDDEHPSSGTVRNWLRTNERFLANYTQAREDQADFYSDEIVTIADTEADPNRARVRIDARKWKAARQRPKMWGDKQQVEHSGNIGIGTALDALPDA